MRSYYYIQWGKFHFKCGWCGFLVVPVYIIDTQVMSTTVPFSTYLVDKKNVWKAWRVREGAEKSDSNR